MTSAAPERRSTKFVLAAAIFEGALGAAGYGLARWFGEPIAARLTASTADLWRSALATAPMLALLVAALRTRWAPLAELRDDVAKLVEEFLGDASWAGLALVSVAAGLGEEILFRGALQPLAVDWLGSAWLGVAAASVVFGALHAATPTYFVLATAIGLYFGWLAEQFDDLVAPIVTHAVYDFAALVSIRRMPRQGEGSAEL
jgi:hypothetical protein